MYSNQPRQFLFFCSTFSLIRALSCPAGCTCVPSAATPVQLYNVTCHRASIPRDFPSPTRAIALSGIKTAYLRSNSFSALKYLEYLSIYKSEVPRLLNNSFVGLRRLKVLSLRRCNLRIIEVAAFRPLRQMITLDMGYNTDLGFRGVSKALCGLQFSRIENVRLRRISIRGVSGSVLHESVFKCLRNTEVKSLVFSFNHVAIMETGYSRYLQHLEHLDMSENTLTGELPAFTELLFLENLRSIDLHKQNAYTVKKEALPRRLAVASTGFCLPLPPNLETILWNQFKTFYFPKFSFRICPSNSLKFVDMSQMNIKTMGEIDGLYKLEYFNLQGNYIEHLNHDFLVKFPNLKTILFGNNRMGRVLEKYSNGSFFKSNEMLSVLDLSKNNINYLSYSFVENFQNISEFNISHNHLQNIDNFAIFRKPAFINASWNAINTISLLTLQALDRHGRNMTIDLTQNPVTSFRSCCAIVDFIKWMKTTPVRLTNAQTFTCLHGSNALKLHQISQTLLSKECGPKKSDLVIGIVITISLVMVAVTVSSICYRKRYTITWWMSLMKRYSRLRADALTDTEKDYDAFVAYSVDDVTWVRRHLVTTLEEKRGYKLCIHNRDFTPGLPIIENIVAAIHKSRRTILVLTSSFVTSEWCEFEVAMADRHSRTEHQCIVIPIMFPSFYSAKAATLLKTIVDQNTYLAWPADRRERPMFWDMLSNALGKPMHQL